MVRFRNALSLVLVVLLVGCAAISRPRPIPDDPDFAPVSPSMAVSDQAATGSIFQSSREFTPFSDRTAVNPGDVLTVVFDEQTSSSKEAESELTKDNEVSFNDASILGGTPSLGSLGLLTNPTFEREFEGEASADQSNSLSGTITVTVVERLANGVLRVRGEKWISLTIGDEYIRLTGLVRPEDISPDNTVPSSRVADARIAYGGTGDLDQANRQGWLSRLFNSEWWPL